MSVMRFWKNSLLIGCVHNSKEGRDCVREILKKEKFDFYFLELNRNNYDFIYNNNFYFSEFFEIMNTIDKTKIKLIDLNYKDELKHYSSNTLDLHNDYISYELAKFTFYYIHDYLDEKYIKSHPIYNTHIKHREENMLNQIKKYKEHKILVITGLYHFEYIYNNLLI